MIPNSYVIYQSETAMNYMLAADNLVVIKIPEDTHYISDDVAIANFELAILYHETHDAPLS